MGIFSVRSPRAEVQNVSMRHSRAFGPSLTRFIACYICACVVIYLYFRYYLTDERGYDRPEPAAVIHNNAFRPLETFSQERVPISSNELFEKLQSKYRARKLSPGMFTRINDYGWRKSNNDSIVGLKTLLSRKFKVPIVLDNKDVMKSINRFTNYGSDLANYSEDFTTMPNNIRMERNSTHDIANASSEEASTYENESFDSDSVQVIPNATKDSLISHRFQDFRRQWLRQRRARVDWQSIIRPCVDNMAWGQVKTHWVKQNRSSTVTSDVIFWDIKPAGEFSKIFIQSKTSDNRTKVVGGDTWRVYVRGPSSVAATVFDHNNGTYEALFLITEPGVHQLIIYLDYSLCDGFRDPPHDWFIKGNAQGKYQEDGLLGPLDDYLMQPLHDGNLSVINVPKSQLNKSLIDNLSKEVDSCAHTCNHLWDGFGQWTNNEWKPYLDESYNWSLSQRYQQTGVLWIYGDSLAIRLLQSVQSRFLCTRLYWGCRRSYNWIYPVISEALSKEQDDNLDFRPEKVIETIVSVLRKREMQRTESVLLLNLGIHFPISVNFTTYQRLIGDLIKELKETELNSQGIRVPKYKAKVIWKSSTAIHKEKAKMTNKTNWRFFTTQRVLLFSAYAMSAMCQAGFDVIDVYPMTDSYPGGTLDVVHYPDKLFAPMETMLEKYKVYDNVRVNFQENGIKRCIG